ncbi:unnamed protein product, partial [Didymodactylos carnosus]
FFVAPSPENQQQDQPLQLQEETPSRMNQSTSTSDLEITAVVNGSLNPADNPDRTTPPQIAQPATEVFGTTVPPPLFTHATVPGIVSPPSPPTSRQSQYKQQGSRRPQILRRVRQTIGKLEEIPTFPAAKRPRTGTPHPTSPPSSHRHFAPIVASSPIVPKVPVPVVPRIVTSTSPPRGTTESTISLAPATALPPRTTGKTTQVMTTSTRTSAPLIPPPQPPAQQQQLQTTTAQVYKPPVWMMPAKNRRSSPSVEQTRPAYKGKQQRFQNGTTSNFNSYTNIRSYIPPPPPTIPSRPPKINPLRSTPVPLMQIKNFRARQQNNQQDHHYAVPPTTDTEQQNFTAPRPRLRDRTTTSKQTKPYAQPKNAQQHVAHPLINLIDKPRQQDYPSQQYQQRNTATRPNHVILSDSTMSRFRLSQFNNNTVN